METTSVQKPVMTDELADYILTKTEYNTAISELTTGYGGYTDYLTDDAFGHNILETHAAGIQKNLEFVEMREQQIAKARELSAKMSKLVAQGLGEKFLQYQIDNYNFKKATGKL